MSIKEIISSFKSKLSRIFGTKKTKQIEDKNFINSDKFSEKIRQEYATRDERTEVVDIEKLNSVIEENLRYRKNYTDYNLLKMISERMAKEIKIEDRKNNEIQTFFKPNDTIKIALDFFKNIDEELYSQAKEIVDGTSIVEFRIYKLKDVKDFSKVEDDGLPEYSRTPCVNGNSNRTVMYVPLKETVEDIFILVHEISHTFDFNTNYESNNRARNMLGEVTPACFESMLAKYLLENKIVEEKDICSREKGNFISKYDDGVETFTKLILMDTKQNKGNITLEDIESMQRRFNLTKNSTRYILNRLISAPDNVDYRARYMMAQLVSPYIIEQYSENTEDTIINLKQYFNEIKEDNFNGALEKIGISFDEKTIDSLIALNNYKIQRLQQSVERTDSTIR